MTTTPSLIEKACALQKEADYLWPRLVQTGELDQESLVRMAQLRLSILTSEAHSDMDRLMQFGALRCVTSFLYCLADSAPEDAAEALASTKMGLAEILIGLNTLRPKFEADAEITLEDLGLFTDRSTLQ